MFVLLYELFEAFYNVAQKFRHLQMLWTSVFTLAATDAGTCLFGIWNVVVNFLVGREKVFFVHKVGIVKRETFGNAYAHGTSINAVSASCTGDGGNGVDNVNNSENSF